jgi:hypothetical protein
MTTNVVMMSCDDSSLEEEEHKQKMENKRKQNESTAGDNNNNNSDKNKNKKKKKNKKKRDMNDELQDEKEHAFAEILSQVTSPVIPTSWSAQLLRTLGYEEPSLAPARQMMIVSSIFTDTNEDKLLEFDDIAWIERIILRETPEGGTEHSYWFNQAIVSQLHLFPQKRIVYVVSDTTSTADVATRLTKALEEAVKCGELDGGLDVIVKHYQDKDKIGDWNILVSHEQSLEHWCFEDVATLVIDEANQPRESVSGSAEMIKHLYNQVLWSTTGPVHRPNGIRASELHFPKDALITETVIYDRQPRQKLVPCVG